MCLVRIIEIIIESKKNRESSSYSYDMSPLYKDYIVHLCVVK